MEDEKAGPSVPGDERRMSTSRYLKLTRLPTLQEVLERRTRPPLDLFCFYIFLQRESSEDALDFWLDVQQHENMCKAYFKDVRRSGRSIDEEWPSFAEHVRSNGSHFSPLLTLASQPGSPNPATASASPNLSSAFHSPDFSSSTPVQRTPSHRRRDTESHGPMSPNLNNESREREQERARTASGSRMSMRGGRGARKSLAPTIIARDRAIEKQALVDSAERIYLRYLLPGAEREIYLPPSLRVLEFPSSHDGDASPFIPDMFHAQKIYVFKALEQDAFPRFLRNKAFGNLTPMGSFVRMILGLLILWGGFVLAFSLIFLDYKPRLTRLWLILPFLVATNLLFSAYYSLSPLLALFQQSETTSPFKHIRVRETYIKRLVGMRALWIEALCILVTAILVVIFTVVPGHRL